MGNFNYRIGLDIGVYSVGWAVIEDNEYGEPCRIEDLGVRLFDTAEVPNTGESIGATRRNARRIRRRLRRKKHRLERIRYLFEAEGLIEIEEFMEKYRYNRLPNVHKLRYEGLDRKLTNEEFVQVLLYIAKHRGFKSTRKAELREEENGQVLSATKKNMEIMKEKGYRTVGEMVYLDDEFRENAAWLNEGVIISPRNKEGDYSHTILRDMLVDEVKTLFEIQNKLGNEKAKERLRDSFLEIMLDQRSYDLGPGNQADGRPSPFGGNLIERLIGRCIFEEEERRVAKSCYTSERFMLLQKANNIMIVSKDMEPRHLNEEERKAVINLAYSKKELKYKDIRGVLKLPYENLFKEINYGARNVKIVESKTKFVSMEWSFYYKILFEIEDMSSISSEEMEVFDNIGEIIAKYKTDKVRSDKLKEIGISSDKIQKLLELAPAKFQHLSLKAIRNIIPYLEKGLTYNEACRKAGYDLDINNEKEKSLLINGEILRETLDDIHNPIVRRSISQTVKVINSIIRKYGSPEAVSIEMEKVLTKDFQDRKEIERRNKKNNDNNSELKKQLIEKGIDNPKGMDLIKFRLWKEQNGICMYSGENIKFEEIFDSNIVEIDHIIPYSISWDDRYINKVLVKSRCNRDKGNNIPYEYFKGNKSSWEKFRTNVESTVKDHKKRDFLLKIKVDEDDLKLFRDRNIMDNKYVTNVFFNMLKNYLYIKPSRYIDEKDRIVSINSSVTSYLKKRWGLKEKLKNTDFHHAVDAVATACYTKKLMQMIFHHVNGRELYYSKGLEFTDMETGEIIKRDDFTQEQWYQKFITDFPKPWKYFDKELEIRMSDNPMYYIDELYKYGYPYNKEIKPVFISRMPRRNVTGVVHADTIRSPRHFKEEGIVVYRTKLSDLRLENTGEIRNYYNPSSDILLYESLKERLKKYNGDGEEAFKEPFYKPKSDGSQGPVVKKVKLYKKQKFGVYVNKGKGIAENAHGAMIRIDVFFEDHKYYFIPIYLSDIIKKQLPNRAVISYKPHAEWKEMKEENFLFSLYTRDLISFKHRKGVKARTVDKKEILVNECLTYYMGADISTASIKGISHDNYFEYRSLGVQSLVYLKKYQVDVLGNYAEVKKEKRLGFNFK